MDLFSERLKELRKLSKMTQKEVGERIGMTAQGYSAFERGREPSFEKLKQLSELFAVSSDYLIGMSDSWNPSDQSTLSDGEDRGRARAGRGGRAWRAADYGRGYSGNRSEEMTQQQQDILNEAIDVCQNEMQANNPNIPRMTFACGFALASMLSVLKMETESEERS